MRVNFSTGGAAPLSKSVIVPSGCSRASCCQANFVLCPILKSLFFPPSRQRIFPVFPSISYTVCVFRAEMR